MHSTNFFKLIGAAGIAACAGLSTVTQPAIAQTTVKKDACVALRVVEGSGETEVRKVIKKGLLGPGNLNTDFVVPTGIRFQYYVLEFTPENNAWYDGTVTMKYASGNSSSVYSRGASLELGKTYYIPFRPPTVTQPFQVNLWVGSALNNSYKATIWACKDVK